MQKSAPRVATNARSDKDEQSSSRLTSHFVASKGSSPPPAAIMSDATESIESCQSRTASAHPSSPLPMREETTRKSSLKRPADSVDDKSNQIQQKESKITSSSKEGTEGSASSLKSDVCSSLPQHERNEQTEQQSQCEVDFISMFQQSKDDLLNRLLETSMHGNLVLINLSRRGLGVNDAALIKQVITQNSHLSVLKLSYNNMGDDGTATIASGFIQDGCHHKNLTVLDLGFNCVGDTGSSALALHAVAGNHNLRTLYLSGNNIRERGALSLAGAILHGSSLTTLHLTANRIGTVGVKALTRAVAETDAKQCAEIVSSEGPAGLTTDGAGTIHRMQELYLGGTSMQSAGFLSISNMVLTNLSLRVLSLSDNGINDQDMALFSQTIAQNKNIPLEVIELSFNNITCVGVECLMNAVWGSKTLREMRLDNNRIKDRGAQLAAVVMTSLDLEVLDLGFNRITTVGIKSLMKSLSEDTSLLSLTLSGIPLDPTASKAVCYALAYNTSIRSFHVDCCSISYAAQRHIAAGIVSNQDPSLRFVTGFQLGAVAVTLGLPQELESWSNDKVLGFVRLMWQRWRQQLEEKRRAQTSQRYGDDNDSRDTDEAQSIGYQSSDGQGTEATQKNEPADPKTVVAASKTAMAYIGNTSCDALNTEPHQREPAAMSPLVPANATMLERTLSGTVREPPLVLPRGDGSMDTPRIVEPWEDNASSRITPESSLSDLTYDPATRKRNIQWLRAHFRSLDEVAHLPYNDEDLLQLHQYFFTPLDSADSSDNSDSSRHSDAEEKEREFSPDSLHSSVDRPVVPPLSSPNVSEMAYLSRENNTERANLETRSSGGASSSNISKVSHTIKRRCSKLMDDTSEDYQGSIDDRSEPLTKRARNAIPRIAYYPRIRMKLDALRVAQQPSSQNKRALVLLRQLKFVECNMHQGRNIDYAKDFPIRREADQATPADIESILLDLL